MTTKEILEKYFPAIHSGGWESYIADDITFINSNFDNIKQGKSAYVQAAGNFFTDTIAVEVRDYIAEDNRVCAQARYTLRSPSGKQGVCDVVEIWKSDGEKLTYCAIFFDTKAFVNFKSS
ncbi:MAG TPA: nuclear transport factor 2 family protein [Patescibacteria group bacterium]|nr:nuclear transport factor 2 family protein [Patescibacteria group bacterium]